MTKYEKDQEKLKRWYLKKLPWVYKNTCSLCGIEFYTHDDEQTTCDPCLQKAGRRNKAKHQKDNA